MSKPFVVTFAGVPGSSKSIVAHYISCEFELPILNNDVIRSEVKEDLLAENIREPRALKEFEKRAKSRRLKLLARGQCFILDGSVDRQWAKIKEDLLKAGYDWFLIDMELGRGFLTRLFSSTGRQRFIDEELDIYLKQHEAFMIKFSNDVSLLVDDQTFQKRLSFTAEALSRFLKNR